MTSPTARTLGALAEAVGGTVVGSSGVEILGVRPLGTAGGQELSFLTNSKYRDQVASTRAGAVLVSPDDADLAESVNASLLVVESPYLALANILRLLYPVPEWEPGIHSTAVVAPSAQVASTARVEAFAVIGENAVVGDGTFIGTHVSVGAGCLLGENVQIHPHAVLYERSVLSSGAILHSGSVVGADGFGYATGEFGNVKMPQVGHVEIAEDVEVGANSTIDRATLDTTRIGRGTKIDNLVQVGHNTQVGENCIFCGQSGVSGSAVIGDRVVLAGQVGVAGHLEIGSDVQVAAKSAVLQSVEGWESGRRNPDCGPG